MATDYEWLQGQLDRYSYRPRWSWLIVRGEDPYLGPLANVWQVRITFWTTDAYNPEREVEIISVQAVPPFVVTERDPELFKRWFQTVIFDAEMHESREWLRRDGLLVDDPHKIK